MDEVSSARTWAAQREHHRLVARGSHAKGDDSEHTPRRSKPVNFCSRMEARAIIRQHQRNLNIGVEDEEDEQTGPRATHVHRDSLDVDVNFDEYILQTFSPDRDTNSRGPAGKVKLKGPKPFVSAMEERIKQRQDRRQASNDDQTPARPKRLRQMDEHNTPEQKTATKPFNFVARSEERIRSRQARRNDKLARSASQGRNSPKSAPRPAARSHFLHNGNLSSPACSLALSSLDVTHSGDHGDGLNSTSETILAPVSTSCIFVPGGAKELEAIRLSQLATAARKAARSPPAGLIGAAKSRGRAGRVKRLGASSSKLTADIFPHEPPTELVLSLGVEQKQRGKHLPMDGIVFGRVFSYNNKMVNDILGIHIIADVVVELYLEHNRIVSLRPLGVMPHLQVIKERTDS